MYISVWIGFAVILFSVFGFCCAVRLLMDLFFPDPNVSLAIAVREPHDVEHLEQLLCRAVANAPYRGMRLAVLISTELMNGIAGEGEELAEEYSELLDRFGADCYLIEP